MVTKAIPKFDAIRIGPTLKEQAFDAIRSAILSRTIQEGALINEKVLAEMLGISKSPVREALVELSSRGLITPLPRRGYRVNILTEEDVCDLFEFRIALETAIIRRIAPSFPKTVELPPAQRGSSDRVFHFFLAEMTGNRHLISAMDRAWDFIEWIDISPVIYKEWERRRNRRHREIWERLTAQDSKGALSRMTHHLDEEKHLILSGLGISVRYS